MRGNRHSGPTKSMTLNAQRRGDAPRLTGMDSSCVEGVCVYVEKPRGTARGGWATAHTGPMSPGCKNN